MKEKEIKVTFEEVKVVELMVDMGRLEEYKSNFLALKNHERETKEIVKVQGHLMSSMVEVVFIMDVETEDEA